MFEGSYQRHAQRRFSGGHGPVAFHCHSSPPRKISHHHSRHHSQRRQKPPIPKGGGEERKRNRALAHFRNVEPDKDEPRPRRVAEPRRYLRLKYVYYCLLCQRCWRWCWHSLPSAQLRVAHSQNCGCSHGRGGVGGRVIHSLVRGSLSVTKSGLIPFEPLDVKGLFLRACGGMVPYERVGLHRGPKRTRRSLTRCFRVTQVLCCRLGRHGARKPWPILTQTLTLS